MNRNYDFFPDKESLTTEDIEDFEAHATIMQNHRLIEMEKKYNQALDLTAKSSDKSA